MSKFGEHNSVDRRAKKSNDKRLSLPDFDTLRDMAKNDPQALESLRLQLCQKVIDNAPEHARARLEGLMFQIESRRRLAQSELDACRDVSRMMHDSLKRMQYMLTDLRAMQSESIMLSSRHNKKSLDKSASAKVLPFRQRRCAD